MCWYARQWPIDALEGSWSRGSYEVVSEFHCLESAKQSSLSPIMNSTVEWNSHTEGVVMAKATSEIKITLKR